jgi:hypothetical protein
VKRRRGKSDSKDAGYNDKEDVLPLTDVALEEEQREQRRLVAFNTAAVVELHHLELMQRAFPSNGVVAGKENTQGAATASITGCRLQSKMGNFRLIVIPLLQSLFSWLHCPLSTLP